MGNLGLSLAANAILLFLLITFIVKQFLQHKKHQDWVDQWPKEAELEHIYTDNLGNKWFGFKNPVKLPTYRGMKADIAVNQADMCMTSSMLNNYVNEIQEYLDKGKLTRAFQLFERLKERTSMLGEEVTLLNLAKVFFLIEGEPPVKGGNEYDKLKEEVFANDSDARDFFLLAAFKLITNAQEFSDSDILAYLKEKERKPQFNLN